MELAELQARASEIIAEITGAEAGVVTSSAAAGLLLGRRQLSREVLG